MFKLENMDLKSFQNYRKDALQRISKDYLESGVYNKGEASQMAEHLFTEMLPEGINTPGQYLYNLTENGKTIGIIWYGVMNNAFGFINDVLIAEPYQNRGYEIEALKLLEEDALKKGIKRLDLHTYTNNKSKLALFEKMGYHPYYLRLSKNLG